MKKLVKESISIEDWEKQYTEKGKAIDDAYFAAERKKREERKHIVNSNPIIKQIKNVLANSKMGVTKEDLESDYVYTEFSKEGDTLDIDIEFDTYGNDDVCNINILYNTKNGNLDFSLLAADFTNMNKHEFSFRAKSLDDFKEKMKDFWNYWENGEKRLTRAEKQDLNNE